MNDPRTKSFLRAMYGIGFRLNDFTTNGILLPSTTAEAALVHLPVHSGPHPEYNSKILDAIGSIAQQHDFAEDAGEAHAALSLVRLVQARLRVSMYQGRLASIDGIDTRMIAKRSRVIDGAIDRMMLRPVSYGQRASD